MRRAGIVGYGGIAAVHAQAIDQLPVCCLSAVCDIDPKQLERAAEQHPVKTFLDYDEMIASGLVDCVHICTPHYLHKDMAVKALQAGCDVVLEKPVAMNSTELAELVEAEKRSGKRVCVMFQNRTNACIRQLKKLMQDEVYSGKLVSMNGLLTWERDEAYYGSGAWRGKLATEGGGVLINQAIHLIDLISYLSGGIAAVRGSVSTKNLEGIIEVEDTADALLKLKNGKRACIYATNCSQFNIPHQLEVCMEKVYYRYADNALYEIRDGKFSKIICMDDDTFPGKKVWGNGHFTVIGSFYGGDGREDEAYPTLAESLNTAQTLFAIYQSANNGGAWVNIE